MRTLLRNKSTLYYASPLDIVEINDEYGDDTGERYVSYGKPVALKMNVGAEKGTYGMSQHGFQPNTTRTLVTDDLNCPITEDSVLWIDTTIDKPYNYVVQSISKSLNSVKITAKRVIK